MTQVVLVGPGKDVERVHSAMAALRPALRFCRPGEPQAAEAQIAISWAPPPGSLGALPNLRLIHSVGAGADNIISEVSRDKNVPICRIVDPGHCQGMFEYVLWGVLHYHRHFDSMLQNQRTDTWQRPAQRAAYETTVGVMGLGTLGKACASGLARFGFNVRGWARGTHTLGGVKTFDSTQLGDFLSGVDILICLLPLTEETRGILCADTFSRLAPGAAVINCGRGAHLREDDLVQALKSRSIRGALLDVFTVEPLPPGHPLWQTDGVVVTPHVASSASFKVIAQQILDNIDRVQAGELPVNRVDGDLGY